MNRFLKRVALYVNQFAREKKAPPDSRKPKAEPTGGYMYAWILLRSPLRLNRRVEIWCISEVRTNEKDNRILCRLQIYAILVVNKGYGNATLTKQNCYLVFSGAWEGKSQIEGKCKKI